MTAAFESDRAGDRTSDQRADRREFVGRGVAHPRRPDRRLHPRRAAACRGVGAFPGDEMARLDQQIRGAQRSEEHTSELQSLMGITYDVHCLKKTKQNSKTMSHKM